MINLHNSWKSVLSEEISKSYFADLLKFVEDERKKFNIFPPSDKVFNAFNLTLPKSIKVVILGQDPYHGKGQAEGLAFSVPDNIKRPPSLRNIMKEIEEDSGISNNDKNCLTKWANQGVLLLNATLTVREASAGSHQKMGWENFTDQVISKISSDLDNIVFLLWGKFAWNKEKLIDNKRHFILKSTHPSPLSAYRGFLGCKHFSETNKILEKIGKEKIDWKL